ncbi:MAG: glycosyltransferase [Clostridium sp.]|nr:glycosyltransferase [Clostridium sp.]
MDMFENQRVLFVTTKNLDYLRNTQEIALLKQIAGDVHVIGSNQKSYPARLMHVYWRLLRYPKTQFDKVFVGFAPQLVIPLFKWKFKGKGIGIDFFISVYDTLVFDRKKFKANGIAARILKWVDTITIQAADHVISDTKAHGNYFIDEFGLSKDKLQVLYLEADKSIYYPRKQEKPERMRDRFTVLYFGSVLPLQGLDVILGAVDLLKENKNLYFVMIGPIDEKYHKPQSDTVEYHDWLSQKELADYINNADLCLAGHFNKDINKAKRTIPGKAYIYDAMKKPMILGDNAATHELYREDMPGIYFVEMGNSQALADTILTVAKRRE